MRTLFCLVTMCLSVCACSTLSSVAEPERPLPPKLTQARYRTIWVPDKIEGDRYIEGHRVHIIEEAGRWMSK